MDRLDRPSTSINLTPGHSYQRPIEARVPRIPLIIMMHVFGTTT